MMNEHNRSPAGGRGTAETAGRMKTHFAPSYFTFRVLTWSPTMAELLRDAGCRLSAEWNGVSLGTLMQLKRASFPMSMFCTDTAQDEMPSKRINLRNCEGDVEGGSDLLQGLPGGLSGNEPTCPYRRLWK